MKEYQEFNQEGRKEFQRAMAGYKVVPSIQAKGYPVTGKGYKESHKASEEHERDKFGTRRFKALQKIIKEKLPPEELAGSHTKQGDIIISAKIPEKYHGQIVEHEKFEHRRMETQRKRKTRRTKRR